MHKMVAFEEEDHTELGNYSFIYIFSMHIYSHAVLQPTCQQTPCEQQMFIYLFTYLGNV